MEQLYQTIKNRNRPEDIAQMILDLQDNFTAKETTLLNKAAKGSLKRNFWGYSSMMETFAEPTDAKKQINKSIELFKLETQEQFDTKSFDATQKFIKKVSALIEKPVGQNNFLTDRKNKQERNETGLDLSKRAYNKRWRLIKRLEYKLLRYIKECRKMEFQKIAKHGIIHHLDESEFLTDGNTAFFIAYYTSRCNLRSEFTISGQQKAFDEISEMLYKRCENKRTTNWWAIAHVYPSVEVISQLTDERKGQLLGQWMLILQDISSLLQEIWNSNAINRKTMVVKKGNDSTTWNTTAGAWNKARDNWMALLYAMGLENILNTLCFGKVMRLIAADVAAWHYKTGGKPDPNITVWNSLPLPWEVFEGKQICTKYTIEKICKKQNIDPEKSGWIAPREHKTVPFQETPELVHGVMIHNPFLAKVLKDHKFFSGKNK